MRRDHRSGGIIAPLFGLQNGGLCWDCGGGVGLDGSEESAAASPRSWRRSLQGGGRFSEERGPMISRRPTSTEVRFGDYDSFVFALTPTYR